MIPRLCIIASVLLGTAHAIGAIIGTNPPAPPLTLQRIATLSADRQIQWRAYLKNSERQLRADQEFFHEELSKHHIKQPTTPPEAHGVRGITLDKAADWYAQPEALRIADILVSFQTPAGGWSKNLDMTKHRREPGERFSADNTSRFPVLSDNDAPRDRNWNYVGTFDNDATVTQLRFLAKVISAPGAKPYKAYRTAFFRGLDYIFAAQYPNGGWPQVWPLQGGYHDAITYNDDAMVQVLELLRNVAGGAGEFGFVPGKTRAPAAESVKRGIECILATQIVVSGRRTVWCQQHDALTLEQRVAERTAHLQETINSLEGVCYHIAHDLRAPLRAMEGYSKILLNQYAPRFDAVGEEYANRISEAAARMDLLIDGLLEYGRLGHEQFPVAAIESGAVLDKVLGLLNGEIGRRQAEIRVQGEWPAVAGNEKLFEIVLISLLSNALKFVSADVAPRVKVCCEVHTHVVRFSVEDNGIGIAPEYLHKAFRIFERLHAKDLYAGTGIGLAIATKAAERMGGRLGAESKPNQGSEFWIELPRAQDDAEAVESETTHAEVIVAA